MVLRGEGAVADVAPATPEMLGRLGELAREAAQIAETRRGGPLLLAERAFPAGEDALSPYLDSADRLLLAGMFAGAVVGVAAARADERPGGRIATVDLIYVEPQARRVGVGDALMELLLSWAAARHCTGIDITVLPGDQASKSLLETWEFSARALTLYRTVELAPSEASSGEGVAAAEGGAHAHAARPEGATASSEGADAGGGHPSASPRRVPCAGAVVIDQGRLLLVRRANPPDAGCWSLPGGRVEAGEDGAAAAVRETLEETGCRVVVERSAGHAVIDGASVTYDIEDFYATLVDPREQPSPGGDAAEAVFVPLDDVSDLELASGLGDWLTRHGIVPGR